MTLSYDTFSTPFGEFSVGVDSTGAVVASAFGPLDALLARVRKCDAIRDADACRIAREQLLAYFAGDHREFDLPLAPEGTAFQQRVWEALRRIPFGETRSYGQLAAELGMSSAARAVGRANATNPICVIIPCHRVIGVNGALTGFAFGEEIKRPLLEHEGALAAPDREAFANAPYRDPLAVW